MAKVDGFLPLFPVSFETGATRTAAGAQNSIVNRTICDTVRVWDEMGKKRLPRGITIQPSASSSSFLFFSSFSFVQTVEMSFKR